MARAKCKECGNEISIEALRCPHCGTSVPKVTPVRLLLGAFVLIGGLWLVIDWAFLDVATQTVVVKASDYGDRWPLTVQEAKLGCAPKSARYIEVNGVRYALNGKALRAGMQRPDGMKRDPSAASMADFIERSGTLCR